MELQETMKQFREIYDNLNEKYGKLMEDIEKLDNDLENLKNNAENASKQFIEDRRAKILSRIAVKRKCADDWLKSQDENLQKWVDTTKQQIQDQIKKQTKALLDALK